MVKLFIQEGSVGRGGLDGLVVPDLVAAPPNAADLRQLLGAVSHLPLLLPSSLHFLELFPHYLLQPLTHASLIQLI